MIFTGYRTSKYYIAFSFMTELVNGFLMHNLITCRVDAQVTTVNATELDSEISTLYGLLGKSDREVLSAGQKCQLRPAVSK